MGQVTYIAMSPEQLDKALEKASKEGVKAYEERLLKEDIRGVKEWSEFLKVDPRTIIKRIEEKKIKTVNVNPYRISKYEILKFDT